ncbi:hypothetical protein FQR65_LT17232 [Abscondita terminalis]|nr:hypothetical protein FQR65_LT17232 [Abscondita terminalis]
MSSLPRNVYQFSDGRAKTNIVALASARGSALNKMLNLKGYSYDWKEVDDSAGKRKRISAADRSPAGNRQIGFMAQEVEKIIPEAVLMVDSSGVKLMSYTQIIPFLVEAIKEQRVIIDQLKTTYTVSATNREIIQKEIIHDTSVRG